MAGAPWALLVLGHAARGGEAARRRGGAAAFAHPLAMTPGLQQLRAPSVCARARARSAWVGGCQGAATGAALLSSPRPHRAQPRAHTTFGTRGAASCCASVLPCDA